MEQDEDQRSFPPQHVCQHLQKYEAQTGVRQKKAVKKRRPQQSAQEACLQALLQNPVTQHETLQELGSKFEPQAGQNTQCGNYHKEVSN